MASLCLDQQIAAPESQAVQVHIKMYPQEKMKAKARVLSTHLLVMREPPQNGRLPPFLHIPTTKGNSFRLATRPPTMRSSEQNKREIAAP